MKNQKKRGTPKRRKKAKPRPRVTALARRPAPAMTFVPQDTISQALTNDPLMPTTFVGTLKLEPKQIDALRRPVLDSEIEWRSGKKDGPEDIPYLSHNGYRDRLD